MKKNLGSTDRIIRILALVVFGALYFTGVIPGTTGLILTIVGAVLATTSFINWCPIYAAFGISTKKSNA